MSFENWHRFVAEQTTRKRGAEHDRKGKRGAAAVQEGVESTQPGQSAGGARAVLEQKGGRDGAAERRSRKGRPGK